MLLVELAIIVLLASKNPNSASVKPSVPFFKVLNSKCNASSVVAIVTPKPLAVFARSSSLVLKLSVHDFMFLVELAIIALLASKNSNYASVKPPTPLFKVLNSEFNAI
jgi:hypothetical protein